MRNSSWNDLLSLIDGKDIGYQPVGFIIDSPWIPGWYGISNIDYYSSDELWLKSNQKAINSFPEIWFLPSFWSEYGMCTEPSAFGSGMVFPEKNLPHAERVISGIEEAGSLTQPNVKTDGLLPFMINRLKNTREEIMRADHQIRFAVSRGPLNIASFLMGTTEFMLAMATDPEKTHILLKKISVFICDWLEWQKECFPSIEGVLILDDIIGFIGEPEFNEFVTPYLKRIFGCTGAKVRFLHNDADGLVTAGKLKEIGVNMFNFSFNHSMGEVRRLAGKEIVLVGNIPPRDVLASGKPEDVDTAVMKAVDEISSYSRIIWSAGGGMPPGVSNENIEAFEKAVKNRFYYS
ncbi:MAG: uroporphyrinogen decarboxylase [Bacteroidetes bacterium GWE2_41_25]|nr:MAG: uroporphyrinogen decarboxylase [Bacteroidetes bacterium GWA2_40_15]OFX93928.1 MAG: uroporphyrinogen decarboxylase [Bacteroidetes bacterium GWE2_41_25]OFY00863.1 MAG: uroporphyrinogen decarboxylase [Bacteroidetes bacterium GWC2_40_22]OFY60005.1 MAG: uroporphyrinogen decarboxylase [Bacteroidetes bacterium GWF2_41_9]HAM10071.1 uroporphyrinogen decarboxylase [Bacteroidales bacterium]